MGLMHVIGIAVIDGAHAVSHQLRVVWTERAPSVNDRKLCSWSGAQPEIGCKVKGGELKIDSSSSNAGRTRRRQAAAVGTANTAAFVPRPLRGLYRKPRTTSGHG